MKLWTCSRGDVAQQCAQLAPRLQGLVPAGVDPVLLMWAEALTESIPGAGGLLYFPPRHEPAYDVGGRYAGGDQAHRLAIFGSAAACSFGPWQVMFSNCPAGYTPERLQDLREAAAAYIAFMLRQLDAQKPRTLAEIGDMYNSGNWRDSNVPADYIARLERNYNVPMPLVMGARA